MAPPDVKGKGGLAPQVLSRPVDERQRIQELVDYWTPLLVRAFGAHGVFDRFGTEARHPLASARATSSVTAVVPTPGLPRIEAVSAA